MVQSEDMKLDREPAKERGEFNVPLNRRREGKIELQEVQVWKSGILSYRTFPVSWSRSDER